MRPSFAFACDERNDLLLAMSGSGCECRRFDTLSEAVRASPVGGAVLALADGYPLCTTVVEPAVWEESAARNQRLYIEFPAGFPGTTAGTPRPTRTERAVVASDFFGPELPAGRILGINGLHFVPMAAGRAHLVAARVAGFDRSVFGLPPETSPLLFEPSRGHVLVATTKLSHFVTGRYAPQDAWKRVWHAVMSWLTPGRPVEAISWTPAVRCAYGRDEALPPDAERRALRRGVDWFVRSKLLLHPSRKQEVAEAAASGGGLVPTPPADAPVGDGSAGILEGPLSVIGMDGSQMQSVSMRGDCNGESAMALAFGGRVFGRPADLAVAGNLLDHWYFTSDAFRNERGDPAHAAFGLGAWGVGSPSWYVANYGDDNARLLLGTIAAAALCGTDRWDEPVMRCLLANLRTTGELGFRTDRLDIPELSAHEWQYFFRRRVTNYCPHMEAYLWACFFWAYHKTGHELFYRRAENALRMTMDLYADGWRWMNGLAQEKARIVLALAWLVRAKDAPANRALLRKGVDGLLALQAPCGAFREELGLPGNGVFPPPASNEAYGTTEASLIQENGDPVCDLLYTTNFAFLGLREAAAAGDRAAAAAEDKLAQFLCRIQARSDVHPSLDGGWFRAFDFERWEAWGSNADAGWGAWAIESGWTQGWITAVLGLRQMNTSLWDLTRDSRAAHHCDALRRGMIPEGSLSGEAAQ